jgi:hypothetical protein
VLGSILSAKSGFRINDFICIFVQQFGLRFHSGEPLGSHAPLLPAAPQRIATLDPTVRQPLKTKGPYDRGWQRTGAPHPKISLKFTIPGVPGLGESGKRLMMRRAAGRCGGRWCAQPAIRTRSAAPAGAPAALVRAQRPLPLRRQKLPLRVHPNWQGPMSIRKRVWKTADGAVRAAWVLDYFDGTRKRRLKTFKRRQDAEKFGAKARVDIGKGIHVSDRDSITVKEAGKLWLAECRADDLEPTTIEQYDQHLRLHIVPFIGATKLSQLGVPTISAFRTKLRDEGRSQAMIRGVMRSLGALISVAQEHGKAAHNPVRELKRTRRRRGKAPEERHKPKLRIGVDIPTPDEIRELRAKAEGRWRPFLMTAVVTGLRASELRGLRWEDVELGNKPQLHVRQRADRYGTSVRRNPRRAIASSPYRQTRHRCCASGN